MQAFIDAVLADDHAAIEALLTENVTFTSPVAFTPYPGKAMTAAILRGVTRVFEGLHYTRTITSPDGRDHALIFEANVNGKLVNGCDFLHLDADGRIDDFTVMVRPLSGAQALSEAMAAQFERIAAEAGES